MVLSIWRYSHLTLAISSFLFVFLAAITGILLALEPIQEQLHPYQYNLDKATLDKTIVALENKYEDVLLIEKDHNNFIIASVITKEGKNEKFYINPNSGEKIGELLEKKPFFQFITNFHRSLFLKSTGRALVGIASLLLFLIAVTGSILIIKRQGGIRQIFTKVVKESTPQYYHVVLSRITLIPIVIITLSGIYLSLEKFDLLPKKKPVETVTILNEVVKKPVSKFPIFKNTTLANFTSLEYPFSEFDDDYFLLKTDAKEVSIHQYSGDIVRETTYSWLHNFTDVSMALHTGQGNILWSVVLLLSTVAILYFIYSGFVIALDRRRKKVIKPKNIISKKEAEIVILVGSETGGTYKPAKALLEALQKINNLVFIDDLNNIEQYENLQKLFILTSTYGKGEAPKNAELFLNKLQQTTFFNPIEYAVVGFGSLAYPDYCEFAIQVDQNLKQKSNTSAILPLEKIHNQSLLQFKNWCKGLSEKMNIPLEIDESLWQINTKELQDFKVISKSEINTDDTFLLTLKPKKRIKFQSGDLLSFYPKDEVTPRYYSIAKVNNNILLSIKKHAFGKASKYLSQLEVGESLKAKIDDNPAFHFPKNKPALLIANGTGIAPFLGMLNTKKEEKHLLWGGRTESSFNIYKPYITNALQEQKLHSFSIGLSRTKNQKYVQDVLKENTSMLLNILKNNGKIMICGSLQMEEGVRKTIKMIGLKNNLNLEVIEKQILSDCY